MNLRKHLTQGVVDFIRRQLDGDPAMELLDKDEHDRTQIQKCLTLFIEVIERNADTPTEGPSDSQILASILERITALADVVVTHEQFDANLQAVSTSVNQLVSANQAFTGIVEQLVTLTNQVIARGVSGTASPEDFSADQKILDSITAQVGQINTANTAATTDVNSAISATQSALASAPAAPAGGTAPTPAPVGGGSTAPVTTTPAPVDGSASGTASTSAS